MDKQEIINKAIRFIQTSPYNFITDEAALDRNMVGLQLCRDPIIACADADDEYFRKLQQPDIMGPHFMLPKEWLPQAKTVISFFLPYTSIIKKANAQNMAWPANEWLHGRIDGQKLINHMCRFLVSIISENGFEAVAPSLDKRFLLNGEPRSRYAMEVTFPDSFPAYQSNWSERHVAFICGLGNFGLSRGLITSQGMAGRFGSIVTSMLLEPDKRKYTIYNEYCIRCGKCVKNCPVNAISLESGKDNTICSDFVQTTEDHCYPYYGCGKCQVQVPCESRIPRRPRSKIQTAEV